MDECSSACALPARPRAIYGQTEYLMGRKRAMIIAMTVVTVVEFAIAEVIYMIPMRHTLIASSLMVTGTGKGHTDRRVCLIDSNDVFFIVVPLARMQMAIMQVIDMIIMDNGHMTTLLAMNVCMFARVGRRLHNFLLS
jgi:hypothetical protein